MYSRYSDKVFGKCISLLKDRAIAEDCCQEIFLKIFLNLGKFSGKSKFSTWLYSVTYNYCIDYIRKNKKYANISVDEERAGEVVEEVSDKEILEIEFNRLEILINMIPIEDKAVLLMKYREDMSIKEICKVFDKSESAIKMKLKRAKMKLKKTYNKQYSSSSHE